MRAEYDWTDEVDAIKSALEIINGLILGLPKCEEMALDEAKTVKHRLTTENLGKEALVDYLKQATIDYKNNAIKAGE